MRGRGHPTVLASWDALTLTSDRPPTHPPFLNPFFFEAVAPRKLVSLLLRAARKKVYFDVNLGSVPLCPLIVLTRSCSCRWGPFSHPWFGVSVLFIYFSPAPIPPLSRSVFFLSFFRNPCVVAAACGPPITVEPVKIRPFHRTPSAGHTHRVRLRETPSPTR